MDLGSASADIGRSKVSFRRRRLLSAGLAVVAASAVMPAPAAASARRAGLVFITGNSHSIGWTQAEPSDRFSRKVMEYTQAGKLAPVAGTILDAGDENPAFGRASIGPSLSFLNALAAERDDLDLIVAVATGKGSTGFVDGSWSARRVSDDGSLLAKAIKRWNDARQALLRRNYEVVPICAVHLSARPDADISAIDQISQRANVYASEIDAYVDLLRSRLDGVQPSFPLISGSMMTEDQMRLLGSDLICFSSAGNGVGWRRANTWFVDPINDWGDGERAHLPIHPFDGAHANRDGSLTEGRLIHVALHKALLNVDPHAPFSTLSSTTALESLYDFRSGSSLDLKGRAPLVQAHAAPAIVQYASSFGTYALTGRRGEDRGFLRDHAITTDFTIVMRVALSSAAPGQTLVTGIDATGSQQFQLFIDQRSRLALRWGRHSLAGPLVLQGTATLLSLALRRHANVIDICIDGRPIHDAVPDAPADIRGLAIGSGLEGDIQSCAIFSEALSTAQLEELALAFYGRF